MAELVVEADDTAGPVRPLPIGPVLETPPTLPLLILIMDTPESRWDEGDADETVCSSGDGVMLARAGGCPIGVIARPEPLLIGGRIVESVKL